MMDPNSMRFLARYPSFRHRDEIVAFVEAGHAIRETDATVPAPVLLSSYAHRARNLRHHLAQVEPARDADLEILLDDVLAFVSRLREAGEDEVRFWELKLDDGTDFTLFEALRAREILGSVKARDQRVRPYDSMA